MKKFILELIVFVIIMTKIVSFMNPGASGRSSGAASPAAGSFAVGLAPVGAIAAPGGDFAGTDGALPADMPADMEAAAKAQAERMISTGDTRAFEAEIRKYAPLLGAPGK